jgi:hypothetical protein
MPTEPDLATAEDAANAEGRADALELTVAVLRRHGDDGAAAKISGMIADPRNIAGRIRRQATDAEAVPSRLH